MNEHILSEPATASFRPQNYPDELESKYGQSIRTRPYSSSLSAEQLFYHKNDAVYKNIKKVNFHDEIPFQDHSNN